MGSSAFLYGVSFPALGLLSSWYFPDSDVVVAFVVSEPRRRGGGGRPRTVPRGIGFRDGCSGASAAMSGYSDLASVYASLQLRQRPVARRRLLLRRAVGVRSCDRLRYTYVGAARVVFFQ